MTKQENCRVVAEWLGFLAPTKDETEEALRDRRYGLRRWTLHRTSNAPIELFSSYYWLPPDFYRSEAENALILDKILADRQAAIHMMVKHDGSFQLNIFRPDRPTLSGRDGGLEARGVNRITAIVEAALALIREGKS